MEPPEDLQQFLRRGRIEGEETTPVEPAPHPGAGIELNPITQLVADLLETTGLVPADRLAQARARAGSGSIAQALVDEGIAESSALAKVAGGALSPSARQPGRGGRRPEALDADPDARTHARGRHPVPARGRPPLHRHRRPDQRPRGRRAADRDAAHLEIGVAPREDIEVELKKLVRATEAWERAALVEEEIELEEEGEEEPPTSRPTTASRTHRSSAS